MTFNILVQCRVEPVSRWQGLLPALLPEDRFHFDPAALGLDGADVLIADLPPKNMAAQSSNLKLIQSLWMGVDRWLGEDALPADVPIARMIDPSMVASMTESVLAHVLHAHLHHDDMRRQQSEGKWDEFYIAPAASRSVGVMGLGALGGAAVQALRQVGFRVHGWSRTEKNIEGVQCHHGDQALPAFLAASEILACLLPLTPATTNLMNAKRFAQMRPGSVFISLGRGKQVVEQDLLHALDNGHLRHAIMDVFEHEPLAPDSVFWHHPRITVTPHCAAFANPDTAAQFIADNVNRLRRGEALLGVVDRTARY